MLNRETLLLRIQTIRLLRRERRTTCPLYGKKRLGISQVGTSMIAGWVWRKNDLYLT